MEVTLADLEGPGLHDVLRRLREASPVEWVPAVGGWLVTGYRPAVEVLRDASSFTVDDPRFSTARVVGPSMLSLDGPAHRRHRAPFAERFLPGRVEERYGPLVEGHVTALLDRVRGSGTADLRQAVSGPLAAAVMASMLGLDGVEAGTVLAWYRAIVAAVTAVTAGEAPDGGAAAAMADLRARLGAAPTGCELSDAEVTANAAVVMFGGVETTDAMIANALTHALATPEGHPARRPDPAGVAATVEESLRMEPAASVVDRYATRDVTLGSRPVARGDLVRVSIAGANRDPAVFADPDTFDPGRPDVRAQLAFARGPHACVAMELARLEARRAVAAVLGTLPGVRPDPSMPPRGLVFRKPERLPVVWDATAADR